MRFHAFKGATAWEVQIGPFWVQWPFLKYIRFRCWPRFGREPNQEEDMKRYSIVGMNYVKTEDFVAALKVGTPVTLVREPDNQHDKNAVAVWVDGRKVGFVPKNQNAALAQFIDQAGEPAPPPMALDSAGPGPRAISATFTRSPNSAYPQVEV